MSTDYLSRVYWPDRSNGSKRTTYGFYYGSPALLNERRSADLRRGVPVSTTTAAGGREGRLEALRLLERRPCTAATVSGAEQEPRRSRLERTPAYLSWSATAAVHCRDGDEEPTRPPRWQHQQQQQPVRSYGSRKSLPPGIGSAASLGVSLRAAPVNDPFVPNSSYKEHVRRRRLAAAVDGSAAWEEATSFSQDAQGSAKNSQIWQRLQKSVRPTVESIGVSETSTRMGRGGGSWRHIKEVLQGMGSRIVFIDGGPSLDDLHRMRSRQLGQRTDRAYSVQAGGGEPDESTHVDTLEKQASESANWRVMR